MKILVIDDVRIFTFTAECNVTYARTLDEAFDALRVPPFEPWKATAWDEVWFDHDLGVDANGNDITIRPLVNRLEEVHHFTPALLPTIHQCVIHTDNPAGKDWIRRGLEKMYPVKVVSGLVDFHIDPSL